MACHDPGNYIGTRIAAGLLLFIASFSVAGTTGIEARTRAYVSKTHLHGIDYDSASALGPAASEVLVKILHSESDKPLWSNAAVTLGIIGGAKANRELRAFLVTRFTGPVDQVTYETLTNIPLVLAVTPGTDSLAAVTFLANGAQRSFWKSLRWSYPAKSRAALQAYLARLCIHGLGYSGTERARVTLEHLRRNPPEKALEKDIAEAVAKSSAVRKLGLSRALKTMRGGP